MVVCLYFANVHYDFRVVNHTSYSICLSLCLDLSAFLPASWLFFLSFPLSGLSSTPPAFMKKGRARRETLARAPTADSTDSEEEWTPSLERRPPGQHTAKDLKSSYQTEKWEMLIMCNPTSYSWNVTSLKLLWHKLNIITIMKGNLLQDCYIRLL